MVERLVKSRILAKGFGFPECPRWHEGALWFSDMHTGEVSRLDPADGSVEVVFRVPGSAAGIGWDAEANVYVVSMTDRAVYRWSGGEPTRFADMRPISTSRTNELESDRRGGFFVSNVGYSFTKEAPKPTVLVRLSVEGELTPVADGLFGPNGMAVSPDGSELLVAETPASRITRFAVEADGTLSGRETLVQLEDGAFPDGIDRAADGSLWISVMGSAEVRHIGRDGATIERVKASQSAWACRLGDDGLLYICTSSGTDIADLDRRPGRIEVVDPRVLFHE